jgi:hypothetical protein
MAVVCLQSSRRKHSGAAEWSQVPDLSPETVRELVGGSLTDPQVAALIEWHAALARALAAFPEADLKSVEPPLRSTPGPTS